MWVGNLSGRSFILSPCVFSVNVKCTHTLLGGFRGSSVRVALHSVVYLEERKHLFLVLMKNKPYYSVVFIACSNEETYNQPLLLLILSVLLEKMPPFPRFFAYCLRGHYHYLCKLWRGGEGIKSRGSP